MKLSKTKVPGVFVLSGVASVEQHGDILLVRDGAKAGIQRVRAKSSGKRGRPKGSKNKLKAAKAAPKKRSKTKTAVKKTQSAKKQPANPVPAQTA